MVQLSIKQLKLSLEHGVIKETVSPEVVNKLYDCAYDKTNGTDNTNICFTGNLKTTIIYKSVYDYLTDKSNINRLNLDIDVDDFYIEFEDPYCAAFWANTPSGDGTGITLQTAKNITNNTVYQNINYFGNRAENDDNPQYRPIQYETLMQIKKFNELKYFGITSSEWYIPIFYYMANLEEVTLPQGFKHISMARFPNIKKIDFRLCGDTLTSLSYPSTLNEIETVIFPPLIHGPGHGNLTTTPKLKNVFFYTLTPDQSSDQSGWTLTSNTIENIWVQDSAYEAWKTNKWGAKSQNISKLRKFSEYIGDDLITEWVDHSIS